MICTRRRAGGGDGDDAGGCVLQNFYYTESLKILRVRLPRITLLGVQYMYIYIYEYLNPPSTKRICISPIY